LSRKEFSFVRSVCGELWNFELFAKTVESEGKEIVRDELKARIDFMWGCDGSCDCDVELLASHFYEFSISDIDKLKPSSLYAILSNPKLVVLNEDSLFDIVHGLASRDFSYFGLLEFVRFEFVSEVCMRRAFEFLSDEFDSITFGIWSNLGKRLTLPITPPSKSDRFFSKPILDSTIISSWPVNFTILQDKDMRLLYRGTRDGFHGTDFHNHCNGHSHTVTLILSTNDCIFGGYTPLTWSSRGGYVPDPSLESFIFTIKNPHNLGARIFNLANAIHAIYDNSMYGPTFGGGHDFHVCDECHTSNSNYSNFGHTYRNDTGIDGARVLTGASNFTVKEIEVFEVMSK
jgi:hypothetical protein